MVTFQNMNQGGDVLVLEKQGGGKFSKDRKLLA